ncbi:MAG: DUF4988 domain-containing protein [Prevotella sp.]|nr:DUF4988 domain-containing protein [Prevotella sp.]
MKRKLFSALLFGACLMASTSTFVSCKDYDDDIQNLQAQIDANSKAIAEIQKLIQSGSVITNVSSTANGVTVTLSNGNTFNVTNGKDGANGKDGVDGANGKDGAPGTVITLGDNGNWFIDGKDSGLAAQGPKGEPGAPGANAAVKGEWYALSADCTKLEYYKDGVKDESKSIVIADLVKNAGVVNAVLTDDYLVLNGVAGSEDPIVISLSTDITAISLWKTGEEVYNAYTNSDKLTFISVEEKENTFPAVAGTVNEDPFTFTEGFFRTTDDKLVIRVSPANATVKAENIMLMDSQGKDLSDLIECTAVEPFEELLYRTRSTGNPTGLYTLTFKLKEGYDADALAAAKTTKVNNVDKSILYAVAAKDGDDCLVASEWNVTLAAGESVYAYDFTVNGTSIKEIRNRYKNCEDGTRTNGVKELVWNVSTKDNPTPATVATEDNSSDRRADRDNPYGIDNRQDKNLLQVAVGEDIKIVYPETVEVDDVDKPAPIKGFYVALDYAFALESKPSELAAWNSYSYEGVTKINADGTIAEKGTLFSGNEGTIKITKLTQGVYDVIGFRVFAVNLDGTLVDPDGRAFYVGVGDATTEGLVEGNVVANVQTDATSDFIATDAFVAGDYPTDNNDVPQWTPDDANNPTYVAVGATTPSSSPAFKVLYYDEKQEETDDMSKVKYVKFQLADASKYIDGETYTQTIKVTKTVVTGASSVTYDVKTITAKMTKVMPSGFPENFSFRPKQEIEEGSGKFRAYMIPGVIGATKPYEVASSFATVGNKDLNNVFYGLDENYKFVLKNSAKDGDSFTNITVTNKDGVTSSPFKYEFEVKNDAFIKDHVECAVEASYLYQGVSTYKDGNTWKVGVAYPVTYDKNLTIVYACWHDAETYAWGVGADKKSLQPEPMWTVDGIDPSTITTQNPDGGPYTSKLKNIVAKNSYNNDFFGGDLEKLVVTNKWLKINGVAMYYTDPTTGTKQTNPYFVPSVNSTTGVITFTQASVQVDAAPVADHVEQLVITVVDAYGHEYNISTDVKVKKPNTATAAKKH